MAPKSKPYQLFLLGPPRLELEGEILRPDTRKALSLLAYLALHDYEFQRDNLTALLWPELDQSRARAALRRTLTPLNHALGKDALLTTRETVQLNPEFSIWVDVRAFEQQIEACLTHGHAPDEVCERCEKPLETALDLYRGHFMEGFSLRDSAAFDDWQFIEAERLGRICTGVLERLTRYLAQESRFESAIKTGLQWLGMDPLHEPAHRALMQLYMLTGQRSQALRQYRECHRILDKELGVSPLEETTQLYEDILENRIKGTSREFLPAAATNRTPISVKQIPEAPIPMVGREEPWETLTTVYQRATGKGQFVVVEGEIGIGKTRIGQEFVDYAQHFGAVIFTARCYEGEKGLAYSPINAALRSALKPDQVALLNQSLAPVWRYEASRLLPELATPTQSLQDFSQADPSGTQSRLYEAVRQIFAALCTGPTAGLLFIDDLQWADSASLDLLAYLVRRLSQLPLMIIGTWRPDYISPHDPLRSLYSESVRAGIGTLIQLERLKEKSVAKIAAHFKKNKPALVTDLYSRTEGLPFFIIEYLTAGPDDHSNTIPEGVREIQQTRFSGLNEAGRQLLTTAAIIGRDFDFETLRSASGRSEEETINALEMLLNRGMLIERIPDETAAGAALTHNLPQYDFSHETLHRVVLEQTSLARKRLLNRRVAESYLTQSQRIEENAARIAHHLSQAGQDQRAAEYFFKAGDHARKLYANAEALAHFQAALAHGHAEPARIHEAIGDLLTLRGEYKKAIFSYEKSASLSTEQALPQIERKLANVHHRRGDYERAASHFQTTLELLGNAGDATGLRALTNIDWSRTALQTGNIELSRRLAETGLELARESRDHPMESLAQNALGLLARKAGRLESAREHFNNAISAAQDQQSARIAALNNLALVFSDEDRYEDAIRLTRQALEACIRIGDRHREAALRNHLSDRLHANGQSEAAMVELKQAVEIFAEIGEESGDLQPEIWKLVEW